jgi:2-methylcitrate dehydratase PrpD
VFAFGRSHHDKNTPHDTASAGFTIMLAPAGRLSDAIADFVTTAAPASLPAAVVEKAKRHILDTLACGLAGACAAEAQSALAMLRATEAPGPVPVWGTEAKFTARSAALVTGIACHAFELDDSGGCDHSGAVVLPAALAALASADRKVSGAEFLLAVVLGYDIARRVLEACGGYRPHNESGWHSTATCGTFGAAVAAARLLGLDRKQTRDAIGHAASFSGGLWAFIHDGSQTKRVHAGRAAESGVLAALLARAGVSGPGHVFEDVWGGFFKTFAPASATPAALVADLGARWRIERVVVKPYASCRGTHAAIDAVGALMTENGIDATAIHSVHVQLSGFLDGMCGGRDVSQLASAQMSLPYALACRIVLGDVGLDAYAEHNRRDERLAAAMAKIVLAVDPAMPGLDEPFVTIATTDGRSFRHRVTDALGSPTNPLSDGALTMKAVSLMRMVLDAPAVERLQAGILSLDGHDDMQWLPGTLSAHATPPLFR